METLQNAIQNWYRAEHAKLAPMSPYQRLCYILRYYRGWLAGTALLIAALCLIGNAAAQSRKQILLEGFFTNDEWNLFDADVIQKDYGAVLSLKSDQRLVFDDGLYIDLGGQASDITSASNGKIVAYMAAGELDFVVTTRPVLTHFEGQVPMKDLAGILPPELLAQLEPYLIEGRDTDGNIIYEALDMTASRYVAGGGADGDPAVTDTYYLFVPYNAPHTDQLAAYIRYCFPADGA